MQTTIHGIVLLAANLTEQSRPHNIRAVSTHSATKHTTLTVETSSDVYRLVEELEEAGATALERTTERLTEARDFAWLEARLLIDGYGLTVIGPMRKLTRVEAV